MLASQRQLSGLLSQHISLLPTVSKGVAAFDHGVLAGAQSRGIKYNLFPRLDILAYLKSIHVAYHPGRPRTETARKLITHLSSDKTRKKFPKLQATWQLLGYDAPTTVCLELVDGRKKSFVGERYTLLEMQDLIDAWQFECHLQYMKNSSLEKARDDD
mmetsp:Transcript_95148/g.188494  ORF Transcript_95148/g.188494 Transcript_95148/m.188494 type:complete len:158 (+) Transcript_95148:44-517(+)